MVGHVNGSGGLHVSAGLPLVRVRAGAALSCQLVTESFVSVGSHWVGRQSAFCVSDGGFCPGCESKPTRLLGYTIVSCERDGRCWPGLFEVSGAAVPAVSDMVRDQGIGTSFECFRRSGKSPVVLAVGEKSPIWLGGYDGVWRLLAAVATLYKLPLPVRGGDVAELWRASTLQARRETLQALLAAER